MGLKKVAEAAAAATGLTGAIQSVVQSAAWKEYYQSGDMSDGILMKRGEKIMADGTKNTKADANLISAGSGIDIQEGQCMILVENGKIVEFCAEPGRYTFDESTAPSFIPSGDGSFKENLVENIKKLGEEAETRKAEVETLTTQAETQQATLAQKEDEIKKLGEEALAIQIGICMSMGRHPPNGLTPYCE